jgi:DNA-binding MarR family transcriptional regulator
MSETLTTPPDPGPNANLGYLFRLAHQRFRAALDDGLRDLGLSAQEYGVLSVFATRSELSTAELARISQVTRQTMHVAVRELEREGLLERRATNLRTVLLRLTRGGQERLAAATTRVRAVERAALAGLSPRDERVVRSWLARVVDVTTAVDGTVEREIGALRR